MQRTHSRSTTRAILALLAALCAPAWGAVTAGPFEIETVEKRVGAGGFPNTSGNPFKRTTITVFRVKHRGKVVGAGEGKQRNEEFWEVKVLEDAPRPAVLLASTGVWLLTEERGQPNVTVLAPPTTDSARWQWLDGPGAQPLPEASAGLRDAGGEPRGERGGRLLRVNRNVLLDVSTLTVRPMMAHTSENVAATGGYNASNEPARALSPGRTQHVLVGNRSVRGNYEYALVVMDHASSRAYGVPFDRNALRFESVRDATPAWIARNFEWTRDTAGAEALRLRRDVKPAPWTGRFVDFGGGMVNYRLEPTTEAMVEAFHAWAVSTVGAVANPSANLPAGASSRAILVEGRALRIAHDPPRRTTSLYAESIGGAPPAHDLVEKIGRAFDAELAAGKHQALFTEFAR